jgi:peptidoglycan hydrolase CwlO-like protein
MTQNSGLRDRLEELGKALVELMMKTGGFPTAQHLEISQWLSEKHQEATHSAALTSEKQQETATSAKDAAWAAARAAESAASEAERQATAAERQARAAESANIRATIALIISIVSIATTIVIAIVGFLSVRAH